MTVAIADRPAFAQAAQGSSQGAQKNWKDRAEYDLYESISKETAPAKRLELLNTWKEKYPSSDFTDVRQQVYMATYTQLNRSADALAIAGEILTGDANNLQALSTALTTIFTAQNPTPAQLDTANKAANQVISNLDTLFGSSNKPQGVSDADWATAKGAMRIRAQNTLGYVAWQRKELEKAETEFIKSLEIDGNQGQVSYWLSNVILAQRKPEKYPAALFHFARAAAYDGPGSLNPQGRQQVMATFEKTYTTYHGVDKEDMARVLAAAKSSALPPADWSVLSKADIARGKLEEEEKLKRENPQLALWRSIKGELTGGNAQSYFESSMKGAQLPEFTGKLIEARPETRPKELLLSIEDGMTPDATLVLDAPLVGKMEPGAELTFKGVATGYTASPFMVTFEVTKDNLSGWKGAPPPKPAKRSTRSKKK